MSHLFDGWRSLNWDFWRVFPKNPKMGIFWIYAVLVFFVADIMYLILVPKEARERFESDR